MRIALYALIVFLSASSLAESSGVRDARAEYLPTDEKPPGVVFGRFLVALQAAQEKDPQFAEGMVYASFKPTVVGETRELLAELLAVHASIESKTREMTAATLCPSDREPPSGDAVYAAFHAKDDRILDIYRDAYLDYRRTLDAKAQVRLDRFIAGNQRAVYHVLWDYEQIYERQGQDPDTLRDEFCADFGASD